MTIALLHEKIMSFFAKKAFDAADCDNDGVEWEAYEAAEHAVIVHPCSTIDEVRVKANFFLTNHAPYDTIRNCYNSEEETLLPFLRSLLGDGGQS